jgi:hypothetical protein
MKNIKDNSYTQEAVAIIQDGEIMFLMEGDIVNIKTDGIEFKKTYKKVVIDPTPDEIWLVDEEYRINIGYDYIEEIEFVSRKLDG